MYRRIQSRASWRSGVYRQEASLFDLNGAIPKLSIESYPEPHMNHSIRLATFVGLVALAVLLPSCGSANATPQQSTPATSNGLIHPSDFVYIVGQSTTAPVMGKVDSPYTVPAGRILIIKSMISRSTALELQAEITVDGDRVVGIETFETSGGPGEGATSVRSAGPFEPGIAVAGGQAVAITNDQTGSAVVLGYLVDA